MVKKQAPFPIYHIKKCAVPSCAQGADCDPYESPDHHVMIDLTDDARDVIETLIFFLVESHAGEIATRHHGDKGGARSCSYCRAINRARALLEFARQEGK